MDRVVGQQAADRRGEGLETWRELLAFHNSDYRTTRLSLAYETPSRRFRPAAGHRRYGSEEGSGKTGAGRSSPERITAVLLPS